MSFPGSCNDAHGEGAKAPATTAPTVSSAKMNTGGGCGGTDEQPGTDGGGVGSSGAWKRSQDVGAVSAGGGRGLAPTKLEALRVIAHIDMDAFYAQIEQVRDPAITGKPVVVVQYPTTMHNIKDMRPDDHRIVEGSASSLIAVSYEARKFGVKRGMKAGEAQKLCKDLVLVQVPTRNAKADISLYRHNGERVVTVLEQAGGELTAVEKASIDEVYVDVTRAAHSLLKAVSSSSANAAEQQRKAINEGGVLPNGRQGKEVGERQDAGEGSEEAGSPDRDEQQRSDVPGRVDELKSASSIVSDKNGNRLSENETTALETKINIGEINWPNKGKHRGGKNGDTRAEGDDRGLGDGVVIEEKRDACSEDVEDQERRMRELKEWQQRGRWEEIGPGGWTAVVSEVIGTHGAGVDDKKKNEDGEVVPPSDDKRLAWWARPATEWTDDEMLLACGAAVVSRLRAAVRSELMYSCTAGIAHNKLLAKLCSNMHKPNAQTVLPSAQVGTVFAKLPVEKVKGWGGKFGVKLMEKLDATTAGEVAAAGPAELQRLLGEVDGWRAWEKSRGIDRDPVKSRSQPKSIGCSKTFPGKAKLTTFAEMERWMSELSKELCLRLNEHEKGEGQTPKTLTVMFGEWQKDGRTKGLSRCCRMVAAEVPAVVAACMKMLKAYKKEPPGLAMLGVSAHGFEETRVKDTPTLESFFSGGGAGGVVVEESIPETSALLPAAMIKSTSTASLPGPPRGSINNFFNEIKDGKVGFDKEGGRNSNSNSCIFGIPEKDEACDEDGVDVQPDWFYNGGLNGSAGSQLMSQRDAGEDSSGRGEETECIAWPENDEVWRCDGVTPRGGSRELELKGTTLGISEDEEVWEQWPGEGDTEEERDDAVRHDEVGEIETVNRDVSEGFRQEGMGIGDGGDNGVKEPRLLFGRGGASGDFGDVDPDVLAELPPEIQREIWMQQVSVLEASLSVVSSILSTVERFQNAKRKRSKGGRGIAGSGRHEGTKRPHPTGGGARRQRGRGRGRGGGSGHMKQGSISSFFGK